MTASVEAVERLACWARGFEGVLAEVLAEGGPRGQGGDGAAGGAVPRRLGEAMRYAVLGGGKRVRGFLVTRCCELCGGTAAAAVPAAVAIECVHAFSLVHDDLPAMDDDDLRRGRPTCHKVYGEAMAVLAGDGLLALAFEILATRLTEPERAAAAVAELAAATGWAGMIGGQVSDILSERVGPPREGAGALSEKATPDLALVQLIHRTKTARLIQSAARLGAISAGVTGERYAACSRFGFELGLAFQIADDLLDVTGSEAALGKAVAKDAGAGKQTYPAAVGIEASRLAARDKAAQAVAALDVFGPPADDLRELARFVVEREK